MVKTKEVKGYKVPQQASRLKAYVNNLKKDKDPNLYDKRMVNALMKIVKDCEWTKSELDYLDSVGYRQSKYEYPKMEQQIKNFEAKSVAWFGWNENYKTALKNFKELARSWNLRALDYGRNFMIDEAIPRDDSHAGYDYIVTGCRKKGEYREGLLNNYNKAVLDAKRKGTFENLILLGTRTQCAPPYDEITGKRNHDFEPKSRLVSMVRFYLILAETVFSHRIQEKMGLSRWYAGGKDIRQQDNIIHSMIRKGYKYWISIDYSKYDQSISRWLLYDAFMIIREAYANDPLFDEELFKIVMNDFMDKTIIDGNGKQRPITKGVPSGSMFTQPIDSIVNKLMIDTYMISKGITNYEMIIMGDDNLIFIDCDIPVDDLLDDLEGYLDRNFGIKMHAKKSKRGSITESPFFLSARWDRDGRWRAPGVLLAKLVQPESFRDYKKHGFTPIQVIDSYAETFPKGLWEFVDRQKFEQMKFAEIERVGPEKYASGLKRFQLLYENKRYSRV